MRSNLKRAKLDGQNNRDSEPLGVTFDMNARQRIVESVLYMCDHFAKRYSAFCGIPYAVRTVHQTPFGEISSGRSLSMRFARPGYNGRVNSKL